MAIKSKGELLDLARGIAERVRAESAQAGVSTLVALAKVDWPLLKHTLGRRCLGEVLRLCGDRRYLAEPPQPQRREIGKTWTLADCLYFVDNVEHRGQLGVSTVEQWKRDFQLVLAEVSGKVEDGVPWLQLIHQHRWPTIPYTAPEVTARMFRRAEVLARVEEFKASIQKTSSRSGMPLVVVFAAAHWPYFGAALKLRMLAQVLNLLGEQHQAEFPAPQSEVIRSWDLEQFKYFVDNVAYDGRIGIEDSRTWLHRFELVSKVAAELEDDGVSYLSAVRYHRWPRKVAGTSVSVPPSGRTAEYYQPIMREMANRYSTWSEFCGAEPRLSRQLMSNGFFELFHGYFVNPNEMKVIDWIYHQVAEGRQYRNFAEIMETGAPGMPYFRAVDVAKREVKRLARQEGLSLDDAKGLVSSKDKKHDYLHVVRVACLMLGVVENPRKTRRAMDGGYDVSRDDSVRDFNADQFGFLLRLLRVKTYQELDTLFPSLVEVIKVKRMRRLIFADSAHRLELVVEQGKEPVLGSAGNDD